MSNIFSASSRPDLYKHTLLGIGNLPVVEKIVRWKTVAHLCEANEL